MFSFILCQENGKFAYLSDAAGGAFPPDTPRSASDLRKLEHNMQIHAPAAYHCELSPYNLLFDN